MTPKGGTPFICLGTSSGSWLTPYMHHFPGVSDGKKSACNVGDPDLIPGFIPGWEDLLEKEMATHSSLLAWKDPWTEQPGRLQSMRSQKGGYN